MLGCIHDHHTEQDHHQHREVGYQDINDPSGRYTRWTEDATGHTYWTFPVAMGAVVPVEEIANAVFEADNSPWDVHGLAGLIRDQMLLAYARTDATHHSLSVGDRVRVGEVEVVCASSGWERVYSAVA